MFHFENPLFSDWRLLSNCGASVRHSNSYYDYDDDCALCAVYRYRCSSRSKIQAMMLPPPLSPFHLGECFQMTELQLLNSQCFQEPRICWSAAAGIPAAVLTVVLSTAPATIQLPTSALSPAQRGFLETWVTTTEMLAIAWWNCRYGLLYLK